jgi:peptidoglycan/xylan/chitin deacetylase (PgdA/CDA1 family)
MTAPLAILCYHRVLPDAARNGAGWPYFARGTAVSLTAFTRQIEALATRLAFVDEAAVRAWATGREDFQRPSVWITFDDGYADVEVSAAPVLAAVSAPAAVFVTTCTLATPPRALAADRWYAALVRAQRRHGVFAVDGVRWSFDLDRPEDRARLVGGPERRYCLHAPAVEQHAMLCALAEALDAPIEPDADLYLSAEALHMLVQQGMSIGGHGATHRPLSRLDGPRLASELAAMQRDFEHHALPRPAAFAYPDAAWSAPAEAAVRVSGHDLGLLLGNTLAQREPLRLGRFLVPDDPRWVERVLVPAMGGAA